MDHYWKMYNGSLASIENLGYGHRAKKKKGETDFGKKKFKLMNTSVSRKTGENVRN